jgi:hypothetical protein
MAAMMIGEMRWKNNPYIGWRLRAGGIISTLYLLILGMFEAYSAAATALDRNRAFPIWEPHLGWGLFVLPCVLIASLFLLHGRRSGLGFSLVILNLCLYAGFLIFESIVHRGQPASNHAVWEVGGFWAALFVGAVLPALCLKTKTQAIFDPQSVFKSTSTEASVQ